MSRRAWVALDSWAYVKGDATSDNIKATKEQFLNSWKHVPGRRVRTFQRTIKAGGAAIPVVVIVAQRPATPPTFIPTARVAP